jgi:hypothetical protein
MSPDDDRSTVLHPLAIRGWTPEAEHLRRRAEDERLASESWWKK